MLIAEAVSYSWIHSKGGPISNECWCALWCVTQCEPVVGLTGVPHQETDASASGNVRSAGVWRKSFSSHLKPRGGACGGRKIPALPFSVFRFHRSRFLTSIIGLDTSILSVFRLRRSRAVWRSLFALRDLSLLSRLSVWFAYFVHHRQGFIQRMLLGIVIAVLRLFAGRSRCIGQRNISDSTERHHTLCASSPFSFGCRVRRGHSIRA